MVSVSVIQSIRESRADAVEARKQAERKVEMLRATLDRAKLTLKAAQSRRDEFLDQEQALAEKQNELYQHCNSDPNHPTAFEATINKYADQQLAVAEKRARAQEVVSDRQRAVEDAQIELLGAERALQRANRQLNEFNARPLTSD